LDAYIDFTFSVMRDTITVRLTDIRQADEGKYVVTFEVEGEPLENIRVALERVFSKSSPSRIKEWLN